MTKVATRTPESGDPASEVALPSTFGGSEPTEAEKQFDQYFAMAQGLIGEDNRHVLLELHNAAGARATKPMTPACCEG